MGIPHNLFCYYNKIYLKIYNFCCELRQILIVFYLFYLVLSCFTLFYIDETIDVPLNHQIQIQYVAPYVCMIMPMINPRTTTHNPATINDLDTTTSSSVVAGVSSIGDSGLLVLDCV